MSEVSGSDMIADAHRPSRPPMFWRVLRVLIIVYCGVLGAVMLFVIMEEGVYEYFNLRDLQRVNDARELLEWLILNGGNASMLVLVMACLAWAVAWHRGEGRRAFRLELFYGFAAALMFLGTVGLIAAVGVVGCRNGHPLLIEELFIVSGIGLAANAPALMMGSYVLWSVTRRARAGRIYKKNRRSLTAGYWGDVVV